MRARILSLVLCCIICCTLLVLPATVRADTAAGAPVLVEETGHTLAYSFRQFYEQHGGLPVFGLPLTEVYSEDGIPVQYFERARFEWHAEIPRVLLGHLGRWAAESYADHPAFVWQEHPPSSETTDNAIFFPESGHSLSEPFLSYWHTYGGVATAGFPISEAFTETNTLDGISYRVQYFERTRLEFHPKQPPEFQVLAGHLGREYLVYHPAPPEATHRVPNPDAAWNAIRPAHITIPRIGVDTPITPTGFSYETWDVPRWSVGFYWPISAYPGTTGNIVLAGHVGYDDSLFHHLPDVQPGDTITVTVARVYYHYVVDEVLVLLPEDTWVMAPTSEETLTLITCIPVDVFSHRLVVRAKPLDNESI